MTDDQSIKDIAQKLGQKGGAATSKKYGPEHYRRIQKLGAASKRAKAKARKEQQI